MDDINIVAVLVAIARRREIAGDEQGDDHGSAMSTLNV